MSKIYINISIDTENMNTLFYNNAYKNSILYIGVNQIVSILKEYGFKATFFLSIFEYFKISKEELFDVIDMIKSYEVGLHTHPLWLGKENMHSYSYEEQCELIKKGLELFEFFGLPRPIVHRAGAYGLNEDTINALIKNKIYIDSSMFFSHENCKSVWSKNRVIKKELMTEYPVSVFHRKMYDKDNNLIADKIVKIDINRMFFDEFIAYVEYCKKHNICYINLFMHSYSLMNFSDGNFSENKRDSKKLYRILDYIKEDSALEVVQYSDLDTIGITFDNDTIPIIERIFDKDKKDEDNY